MGVPYFSLQTEGVSYFSPVPDRDYERPLQPQATGKKKKKKKKISPFKCKYLYFSMK